MLKFWKDVCLGIDLLNIVNDKPRRVLDMASALDTTPYNLQRIVRKLMSSGLIKTAKGKGGGVTRIKGDITLRMVFAAYHPEPEGDLTESGRASDQLNILYLSFLGAVSIYKEGLALQQFASHHTENPNILNVTDIRSHETLKEGKDEPAEETHEMIEIEEHALEADFGNGW